MKSYQESIFGTFKGQDVLAYTFENKLGYRFKVMNYGATILELTAGQVATMYESPVGFRHGPKSLINEETLVLVFGSRDAYTKRYDLDLVREVAGDQIARKVVFFTERREDLENVEQVVLESDILEDSYRAFPYIVYAQLFSLLTSLKVKNRPDTPSPTGTVNRVVQGVIIHPFQQ